MFSIYLSTPILIYCSILAILVGASAGSFLNCMAWRIVHGESVWKGRSHCTSCNHVLGIPDLVPIFSWLLLRGKCRHCGAKIGSRYFLSEAFLGICTLWTLLRFDLTPECARNVLFLFCLFGLSAVDLESMIIPNGFLLTALGIWLVFLPILGMSTGEIITHLTAAVGYFGGFLAISLILDKVLGRDSMGGGDIKLFGVMGLYLGWIPSLFAVILACFLGLFFGLCYNRWNKNQQEGDKAFPFGPAIALATWFMLLYGQQFASWYLSLLG